MPSLVDRLSARFRPRALVAVLSLLLGASASAEHYKVFLMGGQSNMFGYSTNPSDLPGDLQGAQEDTRL